MNNKYRDKIPWDHQDDDLIFEDNEEETGFDIPELEDVKIGEETNNNTESYQYNQDTADITGLIPECCLVDEKENKKKDTQGH